MIKNLKIPLLLFLLLVTSTIFSNDINVYWNLGYAPVTNFYLTEKETEYSHNLTTTDYILDFSPFTASSWSILTGSSVRVNLNKTESLSIELSLPSIDICYHFLEGYTGPYVLVGFPILINIYDDSGISPTIGFGYTLQLHKRWQLNFFHQTIGASKERGTSRILII